VGEVRAGGEISPSTLYGKNALMSSVEQLELKMEPVLHRTTATIPHNVGVNFRAPARCYGDFT